MVRIIGQGTLEDLTGMAFDKKMEKSIVSEFEDSDLIYLDDNGQWAPSDNWGNEKDFWEIVFGVIREGE